MSTLSLLQISCRDTGDDTLECAIPFSATTSHLKPTLSRRPDGFTDTTTSLPPGMPWWAL